MQCERMRAVSEQLRILLLVTNHSIVTCQGNTMDTGQAPPTKFINFAGPGRRYDERVWLGPYFTNIVQQWA